MTGCPRGDRGPLNSHIMQGSSAIRLSPCQTGIPGLSLRALVAVVRSPWPCRMSWFHSKRQI